MTAFARARPAGRYLPGTAFLTAELELIDGNLTKGLNGDLGGIWNPTARLVVGGAGMRIARDADLQVVRTLVMTSDAVVTFQSPGKVVEREIHMCHGVARPFPTDSGDPGWTLGAENDVRPTWVSEAKGAPLVFQFRYPMGSTITAVAAMLGAAPAARTEAPNELSLVEIIREPRRAPTPSLEVLASATDVYVDQATYEAGHDVVVTPDEPIVMDAAYRYGVRIHSENGPTDNAFTGQFMMSLRISLLVSQIDPFVT